ncbi:ABC transporter ATP-binding protein [Brevundimonas sp. SORGH_AS_0993]|uniref:ABC transporter ATP-binding protein n=1 Tax=Brevundimonas sp. SORGH_AS_0993 TaxID=3041794 RepID=UPI00278B7AE2|nr:ATP-binding cassette domain-containing protein [Brevundimonas sp. SORGH_AS_0993]MDQ1153398.1 putative ABC transport system ATP-binding protein [Brevundimonas sp. SORGH_AS_0993]
MLMTRDLAVGRNGVAVATPGDLQVDAGDSLLLLGPSGSGKSTLLFTLAGLLTPIAGEVLLDGGPFSILPAGRRDRVRGERLGLVFQDVHLLAGLSVLDNVLLAPFAAGAAQNPERARTLVEELGLGWALRRPAETLSRGEAQRIAIARAMLMNPSVILADEPTASLDDDNAATVASLLRRAADEAGAALVIATHDQRLKSAFPRQVHLAARRSEAA